MVDVYKETEIIGNLQKRNERHSVSFMQCSYSKRKESSKKRKEVERNVVIPKKLKSKLQLTELSKNSEQERSRFSRKI